jgi:hypothetical protein
MTEEPSDHIELWDMVDLVMDSFLFLDEIPRCVGCGYPISLGLRWSNAGLHESWTDLSGGSWHPNPQGGYPMFEGHRA